MTDLVTLTPYKKAESKKDITIRQLKKENTELKKKIGIYQKGMYDEIEKRDKKLTEAKGLLIGFISKMKKTVYTPYEKDLVERAEQFIKDLEK